MYTTVRGWCKREWGSRPWRLVSYWIALRISSKFRGHCILEYPESLLHYLPNFFVYLSGAANALLTAAKTYNCSASVGAGILACFNDIPPYNDEQALTLTVTCSCYFDQAGRSSKSFEKVLHYLSMILIASLLSLLVSGRLFIYIEWFY